MMERYRHRRRRALDPGPPGRSVAGSRLAPASWRDGEWTPIAEHRPRPSATGRRPPRCCPCPISTPPGRSSTARSGRARARRGRVAVLEDVHGGADLRRCRLADPVFRGAFDRRGAYVFLHPVAGPYPRALPQWPGLAVEFPVRQPRVRSWRCLSGTLDDAARTMRLAGRATWGAPAPIPRPSSRLARATARTRARRARPGPAPLASYLAPHLLRQNRPLEQRRRARARRSRPPARADRVRHRTALMRRCPEGEDPAPEVTLTAGGSPPQTRATPRLGPRASRPDHDPRLRRRGHARAQFGVLGERRAPRSRSRHAWSGSSWPGSRLRAHRAAPCARMCRVSCRTASSHDRRGGGVDHRAGASARPLPVSRRSASPRRRASGYRGRVVEKSWAIVVVHARAAAAMKARVDAAWGRPSGPWSPPRG